ncbi:TatD family hydrolase [Bacillus manliponensis]
MKWFDSHIHIDQYSQEEQRKLIEDVKNDKRIAGLIAVSMDEPSCQRTLQLAKKESFIHPALGYHPEQEVDVQQCERIYQLIEKESHRIVAIGEVGLPYYLRQEHPNFSLSPYVEVLERFVYLAKKYDLPIILHAIYDDAEIVCDVLEAYRVKKAHFHWFKGSKSTMERMIKNDYFLSVTPDILQKEKIRDIVSFYPLTNMMVETDGPWPFQEGVMTHPSMIYDVLANISDIKAISVEEVATVIYENTYSFYPALTGCKNLASKLERNRRSLGGRLTVRKNPIRSTNTQWGDGEPPH